MDEADQESPNPATAVTGMLVAGGVKDQCSPDLAARLFECKLVQLFVEVCHGLGAESAQDCAKSDWLVEKIGRLTVPLPLFDGIGPAVETIASTPLVIAGRMVSRSASKPP